MRRAPSCVWSCFAGAALPELLCRSCFAGAVCRSCLPGSCLPGLPLTLVDLPRIGADGGRCADISPACRVGGSTTVCGAGSTVATRVERPGSVRYWGRGASATVSVQPKTMVDPPTGHAGEMSADRPPSAPIRGGSATVYINPGRIGHRLHQSGADRPLSTSIRGGSTTVNGRAARRRGGEAARRRDGEWTGRPNVDDPDVDDSGGQSAEIREISRLDVRVRDP
jgi:hypothetical protein